MILEQLADLARRKRMFRFVTLSLCLGISTTCLEAQVVLQQPVVGVTGVQTVVSVPDGGSGYLGGVSRARDSRATYGFTPFGSSLGREVYRSGTDVRVTIHDFEAMDQRLLAQPRENEYQFRKATTASAWRQLGRTASRVQASVPATDRSTVTADPLEPQVSSGAVPLAGKTPAERLLALGDTALQRSDRVGAMRYYQSARRLGSMLAAQRIQALLAD
jgi:hypothetical protein